jgi:hypothetical protein
LHRPDAPATSPKKRWSDWEPIQPDHFNWG